MSRHQSQTSDKKPNLLVCDDDALTRKSMRLAFETDYDVTLTKDTDEALALLRSRSFHVMTLDIAIRDRTEGLLALPKIREITEDMPILMLSSYQEFEDVRTALTMGANDFHVKSPQLSALKLKIEHLLERTRNDKTKRALAKNVIKESERYRLIGESSTLQSLRNLIEKYKKSSGNVLITGEMGVGKEVVARLLRRTLAHNIPEPFVTIDSSTLNQNLAESLLFGHERGAFTGADSERAGLFEEADGGLVFFDEIGNMPLSIQSKLLRVLQEKEIVRLGSHRPRSIDFRVISATNKNLRLEVEQGRFLPDLLERLDVLPLKVSPLRERPEDIPNLVDHFFSRTRRPDFSISREALTQLKQYSWPGNVRELYSTLEYACTLSEVSEIAVSHLPPKLFQQLTFNELEPRRTNVQEIAGHAAGPKAAHNFKERLKEQERLYLASAYHEAGGNISRLAKTLKADRSHLYLKLTRLGIHSARK